MDTFLTRIPRTFKTHDFLWCVLCKALNRLKCEIMKEGLFDDERLPAFCDRGSRGEHLPERIPQGEWLMQDSLKKAES